MCGIVGIISKNRICKEAVKDIIEQMTNTLIHRGPDGYGYYYGENFVFGHRRLAIVDLSEAGKQPMEYMDRYVITYNGEIYNYIELKEELKANGYRFHTKTDTEVIMASYDFWGADCLKKFNGMWAFVIYDKKRNIFFMSRDRFGKKPFYYYRDNNTFIFASEIKAILTHPKIKPEPNFDFLNDYIQNGCKEYVKETAFKNIYRFDYAHYFEGTKEEIFNEFKLQRYWELKPNLKKEKFNEQKAKEYAQKYYELLEDAVRIRLRADVKVGSALSGGLDSSSVVYIVNKLLKDQKNEELQETFSSVYKSKGTEYCDESKFIKILANRLNVKSNQIEPKMIDIPIEHQKMIYYMENPPESTCMSGWHTFKLVSSTNVKITIDGQGADEQLAGYLSYLSNYLSSLSFIEMIKEGIACIIRIPGSKRYVIIGMLLGLYRIIFGERFLKFTIKKFFGKDFETNLNKKLADDINKNLITLIHYSDHVSMAHSIESRMPFMDYRLVEFLASVPACYKIHNGWTKYIARLAFDGKLPDDIVWRRDKMGWPIPEDYWFRGELKSWFINKIKSSKLVKRYGIDIEKELDSSISITKLIRYLNLATFEEVFLKKEDKWL